MWVVVDDEVLVGNEFSGGLGGNGCAGELGCAGSDFDNSRAAGPETPPPLSRSSLSSAAVSATARTVSMSMRSWIPSRPRPAYLPETTAERMCPYWMASATWPLGRRAMCQARDRRNRLRPILPCGSGGMTSWARLCRARLGIGPVHEFVYPARIAPRTIDPVLPACPCDRGRRSRIAVRRWGPSFPTREWR